MNSLCRDHVSDVPLLDGTLVTLRRLHPDDFDAVIALSETLTDRERYLRLFTQHPAHLEAWARSLTERSSELYALGAFDAGKLIGVANYATCKAPGYAEVAVVVAHSEHMRGVGTALLRQLGQTARRNGLHHFVADVLAGNHLMRQVMVDAGWAGTAHLDGSVLSIELNLADFE